VGSQKQSSINIGLKTFFSRTGPDILQGNRQSTVFQIEGLNYRSRLDERISCVFFFI
jgi:hypothetical protein